MRVLQQDLGEDKYRCGVLGGPEGCGMGQGERIGWRKGPG